MPKPKPQYDVDKSRKKSRDRARKLRQPRGFARRCVPVSWLRVKFRAEQRAPYLPRKEGMRIITVKAPYGTLLGKKLKTAENVSIFKGQLKSLRPLHADGSAKWWAVLQSRTFADSAKTEAERKHSSLPMHMRKARRQVAEEKAALDNGAGECSAVGIVALIKVHACVDTDSEEACSRRHRQWITGTSKWAFLVEDAIHLDPPIECIGSQAFVGVPDAARAALIVCLHAMGRLDVNV